MSSSEIGLRKGLSEEFGPTVSADEKLLSECVNMCQMFGLTASDLLYKWEALSYSNTRSISIFTMDSCAALKAKLQRDKTTEQAKSNKPTGRAQIQGNMSILKGRVGLPAKFRPGDLDGALRVGKPPIKSGAGAFGDEKRNGIAGPSRVTFKGPKNDEESRKKRAYRYMYEKVSGRSEVLDDRIDEFAEIIRDHYNISELGDPSASTEESTTVVGRICLDSEASSQNVKLNEASLFLESSRMMGSGTRMPLRFEPEVKVRGGPKGIGGIGLFPGEIVALKGKNGGGGWFLVDEILAIPPMKISPNSLGTGVKPESGDTSFSMCIASGPFTPDADLKYTAWQTLIESLKTSKPTVLLLIGPFVDTFHPQIRSGDLDTTPAHLFRELFTKNLRDWLDLSPGSMALLVPSVRDIINDHAVFPQSEFSAGFAADPRIRLLPNPCWFTLNDVSFAVSSVDILFHLRKEEFFKSAQEIDSIPSPVDDASGTNDSMSNLCRHLLLQRSFYPIFPVPLDLSSDVNLDISHSEGLRISSDPDAVEEYAPDVVIVPSRLKHFSKVVDNTVAINPSFLSKSTYSTLSYGGKAPGPVKGQISVDLVKLG